MDINERKAAVKRSFFAYRNGVVADVMRRGGSPYHMIFGLTLAQVADIANGIGRDDELARELWFTDDVRESAMLAPMLVNPDIFGCEDAIEWVVAVKSVEIADILALKLLRRTECVSEIVSVLCREDQDDLQRYVGLRTAFGLLASDPEPVRLLAQNELKRNCQLTAPVARQLLGMLQPSE
ncbi:MAG: hypothetical protein K2M98_08195 [Muribaculum sp.]|nr:hypothetical protein [Muribaculum sp.]